MCVSPAVRIADLRLTITNLLIRPPAPHRDHPDFLCCSHSCDLIDVGISAFSGPAAPVPASCASAARFEHPIGRTLSTSKTDLSQAVTPGVARLRTAPIPSSARPFGPAPRFEKSKTVPKGRNATNAIQTAVLALAAPGQSKRIRLSIAGSL